MNSHLRRVAIAAGSVLLLAIAAPQAASAAACSGSWHNSYATNIFRGSTVIGTLRTYEELNGERKRIRSCFVLESVAYRGTRKYMRLTLRRPSSRGRAIVTDAGNYRYYAGPLYATGRQLPYAEIVLHRPNGSDLVHTGIGPLGRRGVLDLSR